MALYESHYQSNNYSAAALFQKRIIIKHVFKVKKRKKQFFVVEWATMYNYDFIPRDLWFPFLFLLHIFFYIAVWNKCLFMRVDCEASHGDINLILNMMKWTWIMRVAVVHIWMNWVDAFKYKYKVYKDNEDLSHLNVLTYTHTRMITIINWRGRKLKKHMRGGRKN